MTPYEKRLNELYHSPKNIQMLPKLIIACILICFVKYAAFGIICFIIAYAIFCYENNSELNRDPDILALRKYYIAEKDRLIGKSVDELFYDELYGFYKKYY